MIRSTVRSAILALSSLASAAPIEVITATFILVTLTYFQLLHAIKGSEFFQVPPAVAPPAKPVHLVRLSHPPSIDDSPYLYPSAPYSTFLNSFSNSNAWQPLPSTEFRKVLEANALEGGYVFPSDAGGNTQGEKAAVALVKQITLVKEDGEGSTGEWEKWLLNDFGVDVGGKKYTYQDLCFECNTALTPHPLYPSQSTLTLYLLPPTPDTPTLTYLNQLSRLPAFTPTGSNSTFRILPAAGSSWGLLPSFDGAGLFAGVGDGTNASEKEDEDALSGLRNVRWFAFAARAFVMRFVTLAKVSQATTNSLHCAEEQNADSADIFVVLLGYILMHVTFVHLFINMRNLGSSFWLRESRAWIWRRYKAQCLLPSHRHARLVHVRLPRRPPRSVPAECADRPGQHVRGPSLPGHYRRFRQAFHARPSRL